MGECSSNIPPIDFGNGECAPGPTESSNRLKINVCGNVYDKYDNHIGQIDLHNVDLTKDNCELEMFKDGTFVGTIIVVNDN